MLLIIIGFVGSYVSIYRGLIGYKGSFEDHLYAFILSPFLSLVVAIFIALFSMLLGLFCDSSYKVVNKIDLVSMKQSDSIRGAFVLFGGHIDNKPVYRFYKKLPGGAFSLGSEYCDDSVIYEDTKEDGYLLKKQDTLDNKWTNLFALKIGERNEFHIPKGSIKKEFSL